MNASTIVVGNSPKPKRTKHGGRKKGTPNKLNGDLKAYVLDAARTLEAEGRGLEAWARDNPNLYWTHMFKGVLPKPIEVSGPGGKPIPITLAIKFVTPKKERQQDASK